MNVGSLVRIIPDFKYMFPGHFRHKVYTVHHIQDGKAVIGTFWEGVAPYGVPTHKFSPEGSEVREALLEAPLECFEELGVAYKPII